MKDKINNISQTNFKTVHYKSIEKIGPEISGVKRSLNIPVFSRRDSSEIKAYVKCYESNLNNSF